MKRPRTYHANSQKRLRSALRDAKYSTPRILELNTTDELQNYSYVVQNMLRKTSPSMLRHLEIEARMGQIVTHRQKRKSFKKFSPGVEKNYFKKLKQVLSNHFGPQATKTTLDIYYSISKYKQVRVQINEATQQIDHCIFKDQKEKKEMSIKGRGALKITAALETPVGDPKFISMAVDLMKPIHPWWKLNCGGTCTVSDFISSYPPLQKELATKMVWVMSEPACIASVRGDMVPMKPFEAMWPETIHLSCRAGNVGSFYYPEAAYTIEVRPTQCTVITENGYVASADVKPTIYRRKERTTFHLGSTTIDLTVVTESRRSLDDVNSWNAHKRYEVEYEIDGSQHHSDFHQLGERMMRDIIHILQP